MRVNRWLLAFAALTAIGLLATLNSKSQGQAPPAKRRVAWEYRQEWESTHEKDQKMLTAAGRDGWELVAAGTDRRRGMRFLFKRPLEP
jgi:hypothetical protein